MRKGEAVPAIPMGCAALCHSLDEDAQLLQAHVRPGPHANDADAQALSVCGGEAGERTVGGERLVACVVVERSCSLGLAEDRVRDPPHL